MEAQTLQLEENQKGLRKISRRILDASILWPADGRADPLRQDIIEMLSTIETMEPQRALNYLQALSVLVRRLPDKIISIRSGDLARLANNTRTLTAIRREHREWGFERVFTMWLDACGVITTPVGVSVH